MTHQATIPVNTDGDIVVARQRGRELAQEVGLSPTDATLLATAISEVARNIITYASPGQIEIAIVDEQDRRGIQVVATDTGLGIEDVQRAMEEGYTTGLGTGLGLPGARRLVDDFQIHSAPGHGTTVTMTKWSTGLV